jgi:hypothetical protein
MWRNTHTHSTHETTHKATILFDVSANLLETLLLASEAAHCFASAASPSFFFSILTSIPPLYRLLLCYSLPFSFSIVYSSTFYLLLPHEVDSSRNAKKKRISRCPSLLAIGSMISTTGARLPLSTSFLP